MAWHIDVVYLWGRDRKTGTESYHNQRHLKGHWGFPPYKKTNMWTLAAMVAGCGCAGSVGWDLAVP